MFLTPAPQLAAKGILEERKVGRQKIFIHGDLLDVLVREEGTMP